MKTRDHIAKADSILARCEPSTPLEGMVLAIAHAVVGWVRHDTGWDQEAE